MANNYKNSSDSKSIYGYSVSFDDDDATQHKSRSSFSDSIESKFYPDKHAARPDKTQNTAANASNANTTSNTNGKSNAYAQAKDSRYYDKARELNLGDRYGSVKEQKADPEDIKMNYTEDDLRPSDETMRYKSDRPSDDLEMFDSDMRGIEKTYTITTKSKILIAVYALVIVTVFALIILNTKLLKDMNATYALRESQKAELITEISDLNSELDYVSSDEVIEEKAMEKGMIKSSTND